MLTLFVDYNRVGHAHRFSLNLTGPERAQVAPGDVVRLTGDGVPPATARVDEIDEAGRARLAVLERTAQTSA
jgi:hypothetical protein